MSLVGHRIIIKAVNLKIIAACVYACVTSHARSQESSSSVDVCREQQQRLGKRPQKILKQLSSCDYFAIIILFNNTGKVRHLHWPWIAE